MGLYNSFDAYTKSLHTRFKKASMNGIRGSQKASLFMATELRITAPTKSSKLRGSVRRRKTANGWSVLAGYKNKGFNVGRWVNREITSRYALDSFNPFFRVGQVLRYGDTAFSPSGNQIRWTAKATPWFDTAWNKTVSRYRSSYKQVRAALRG